MKPRMTLGFFLALAALLVVASIGCAPAEEPTPEPMPPDEPIEEEAAVPQAYFVGLEDGDTVGTIVELEFGVDNFEIEPVGDGMIHAGKGHYHIGLDTECLPPGTVIPTADPWIHFGDGSNIIEMSLDPGEHTLVLQIGDGEHRTLDEPGLCHVIQVTADENYVPEEDPLDEPAE